MQFDFCINFSSNISKISDSSNCCTTGGNTIFSKFSSGWWGSGDVSSFPLTDSTENALGLS